MKASDPYHCAIECNAVLNVLLSPSTPNNATKDQGDANGLGLCFCEISHIF